MERNFAETTALKIMNNKLRGKPKEVVYELSDAELAVLRSALEFWTVGMSQVLANRIGLAESQHMIKHVLALPEEKRVALANSASKALEENETPDDADFAAFILSNHADQLLIEDEIKRRESLQ